jgi:FkbH-like protein
VNEFLALAKARFARQRDQRPLNRLKENAGYLAEVAWGQLYLRQCDSLGAWVRVVGRPRVDNQGRLTVGDRTRLVCNFAPIELRTGPQGAIAIGRQCAINFGTVISAARSVKIGDRTSMGPYCIISDTEVADPDVRAGKEPDPVHIGEGVWLASRVTILPGTRIGDEAVITAGSVVSGEIPARTVAGGSPARVLRYLEGSAPEDSASSGSNGRTTHGTARVTRDRQATARNGAAAPIPVPAAEPDHRGLLVSDFTIDELARHLEGAAAPTMAATVAPFGQVFPALMSPKDPQHDYAVVWTRPEGVLPSFARLLDFELVDEQTLLDEVDRFASLLLDGLKSYRFAFVPTWVVPPWRRGLGFVDARAYGVTRALSAVNQRLMTRLGESPNVFVLNTQRWCDEVGKGAHSARLWYMGKVPFHALVFERAASDIRAAVQSLTGRARKIVVLDLDDTLWGGIVGEVGWEQLRLGGHDSLGEAFVDFQHALKALKRRGILLALVSKNDESVALEAIRRHPEMVLKEDDFVGWRINWQDKARNVADLVASLNLGLEAAVFIDDNPFERARVREALPEVLVPDWPEDKLAYAPALLSLHCFDSLTRTAEDAARTDMYVSDRKREELKSQVGSLDDWLKSLQLRVRVERINAANLARITQLLNKTNQLNLTTRRMTEPELKGWLAAPGRELLALSVSDRLGDAGLTGIVSLEAEGDVGKITDFVLSCRVMGRRVEETMVHLAVDAARKKSLRRVVAEWLPTKKNGPCLEFWQRSGFQAETPTRFVWDAQNEYGLPEAIALDRFG